MKLPAGLAAAMTPVVRATTTCPCRGSLCTKKGRIYTIYGVDKNLLYVDDGTPLLPYEAKPANAAADLLFNEMGWWR